jgi:hypothetical protein
LLHLLLGLFSQTDSSWFAYLYWSCHQFFWLGLELEKSLESKYQGQPGIYTQFARSGTREEVARMPVAEGCRALQVMGERRCNLMYTIYKQAKKLGLSAKYLYLRQ